MESNLLFGYVYDRVAENVTGKDDLNSPEFRRHLFALNMQGVKKIRDYLDFVLIFASCCWNRWI